MSKVIVAILSITISVETACRRETELPPAAPPPAETVALADLIREGSEYDGALVRVEGWSRVEFEGNSLYINLGDYEARNDARAVWLALGWPVSPETQALDGEHVIVEGRYYVDLKGHEGDYSGALVEIRRLERPPSTNP